MPDYISESLHRFQGNQTMDVFFPSANRIDKNTFLMGNLINVLEYDFTIFTGKKDRGALFCSPNAMDKNASI